MRSKFYLLAVALIGLAVSHVANAGFVDARTQPASISKADSVPSGTPAADTSAAPAAQPHSSTVVLRAGKRMDEELRRLAPAGWTVEPCPFVIPADFIVTNEFEAAVGELMRAANVAGVRVRARFFHGNNKLRIVEY